MKVKTYYYRPMVDEKLVHLALRRLNEARKSLLFVAKVMKNKRIKAQIKVDPETEGGAECQ